MSKQDVWLAELKICFPPYKLIYSALFVIFFSLFRGISYTDEIGPALEGALPILSLVFLADTYWQEYRGKRWEIIRLVPVAKRARLIRRRAGLQLLYLSLLAALGYFCFYWQRPYTLGSVSSLWLYGTYLVSAIPCMAFFGLLAQTLVNLTHNQWVGMGVTLLVYLSQNSVKGNQTLGKFNVFAYVFREGLTKAGYNWLWGTGVALLGCLLLLLLVPGILKKRG